ncbi:MAG: helix-turn-helix domain-containing protein [Thermoplasmata archaeon]|nr:helix-turn-helix domain-containing protein [Thermoplasmata archaeon]
MGTEAPLLELDTRKRIYQYIVSNPGAHLRKIARDLNMNLGVVEYHLRALERDDLVVGREEGRYRRFYAEGKVGSEDKKLLSLLRQEVPRRVILHILQEGEATAGELAEASGVSPGTLTFHLKKLKKAGAVEVEKRGRQRVVRLTDPRRVARLLIMYKESFTDTLVKSFVSTWEELGLKFP